MNPEADEDGDDPFNDEYPAPRQELTPDHFHDFLGTTGKTQPLQDSPSPSSVARNSVHLGNQRRQKTVECTGADASAEEDNVAPQELVPAVIRADEVRGARHKGRLGHALEEPAGDEAPPALGQAAADNGDACDIMSDRRCELRGCVGSLRAGVPWKLAYPSKTS